jgi:transposase
MRTRRKFTAAFKSQVVLQVLSGERTVAEVCREHELTAQRVSDWKAQFLAGAAQVFEQGKPASEEAARIAELEQMVGKLTMQLEIAKKASSLLTGTSSRNGKRR